MKKASRILLTIGGIIDMVAGITLFVSAFYIFIAAIVFFSTGGGVSLFFYYYPADIEEPGTAATLAVTICAIVYTCSALLVTGLGVLAIITAKKTFAARDNGDKNKYIAVIVLNAVVDCPPAIIGAIFGLITYNKENQEVK